MIRKLKLLWLFIGFLKALDDEDYTLAARIWPDNPVVLKRRADVDFEKLNDEINELERQK